MKRKTVPYKPCPCGKRDFGNEHQADKALGRARAKRSRLAQRNGTRRGMVIESRYYMCDFGGYHLTQQSRRQYMAVAA